MKRALLAVLALTAALLVGVVGPAHAESDFCAGLEDAKDTTGPAYVSSSVSPSSVVIGKIKRTITVTVNASDECGVEDVDVTMTVRGNSSKGFIWLTQFKLVAGTAENGTWRATEVLSDYEDGGAYVASEILLWDNNVNKTTKLYGGGTLQVRHATTTKLSKPTAKVKKNKKVTIKGDIELSGVVDETTTLKVQARTSPKKSWATVKTIKSDFFGGYTTKLKVTKTKYYRVIHLQDATTVASASKSYKVTKK